MWCFFYMRLRVLEQRQFRIGPNDLPFAAARWTSVPDRRVSIAGLHREGNAALRFTGGTLGLATISWRERRDVVGLGRLDGKGNGPKDIYKNCNARFLDEFKEGRKATETK